MAANQPDRQTGQAVASQRQVPGPQFLVTDLPTEVGIPRAMACVDDHVAVVFSLLVFTYEHDGVCPDLFAAGNTGSQGSVHPGSSQRVARLKEMAFIVGWDSTKNTPGIHGIAYLAAVSCVGRMNQTADRMIHE